MPRFIAAQFLLLLASCTTTTQDWTREEQAAVTTRSFPTLSPSQATAIAERVVRAIRPDKMQFAYRDNGFRATRGSFQYFVFGAAQLDYAYDVTVRPAGSGSIVQLIVQSGGTALTSVGALPGGEGMVRAQTPYETIFRRMEYVAGTRPEWTPCGALQGFNEPVCVSANDDPIQ
ncbi:MAG: hypothetical protein AAFQ04_09525 [Pseudomonadota bacterium]